MRYSTWNGPTGIRFTCILGTVSSIRLSPDQLKDFLSLVGGLRPCRSFWCGQEFPAVHSIRARKILEFFPGSCIFIND